MRSARDIAQQCGKARASGPGYMCKCPCHEDKTASLWVVDTDNGGVNVECKAGCNWKTIKDALGIDIKSASNSNGSEITYDYRDDAGNLLFQKVRRPGKKFLIRRPDKLQESGWSYNLKGIDQKPLYNLPQIKAAIAAKQPVAIFEGEKDCNNFAKFTDFGVATTNFDGAGKWREEYSRTLKGASVLVFYDQDEPGVAHRDAIVKSLKPYAYSISIAHLPGSFANKPVKDFSDWLAAGATQEDFANLQIETIQEQPAKKEAPECASSWLLKDEIAANPLLNGVFDKGDKILLVGKSKTRKSFFSLQLAFCLASGRSFLGFDALEPCKVLLVQSEIKKDRYHARCKRMANALSIHASELENLFIFNARGIMALQDELEAQVIACKPDLVIIDPFYKLVTGDENLAEDVKPILKFFDSLAERTGAAVLYVHHDKKGTAGDLDLRDRGSGTGLLARDFDAGIFLTEHEDGDGLVVVECLTRNYKVPLPFAATWGECCFAHSDAEASKKTSRSGNKTKKAKLPELLEKGENVARELYNGGKREVSMAVFNQLLADAGIPVKTSGSAVKEQLKEKLLISVTGVKGKKATGERIVQLLDGLASIRDSALYAELEDEQIPF